MPRAVRNFWVEVDVDGRKETFASGPRGASGGISIRIMMRKEGSVVDVLNIDGSYGGKRDELVLVVDDLEDPNNRIEKTAYRNKPVKTPVEQLAEGTEGVV